MTASKITVRRALISVSDKSNLVKFAHALHALDVEILSTGGTAKLLLEADIPVIEVSSYTGFPELMDGRVKTLHPKIHGGLLGRRGIDDSIMAEHEIPPIDLLVVNLYPFEQTIAKPDCTLAQALENIDIGGPAMLRAAAKNHSGVAVVTDSTDYEAIAAELHEQSGQLSAATCFQLAVKTFAHTARYDAAISNYLSAINENQQRQTFPRTFTAQFEQIQTLRYGENPHQKAAFYRDQQAASDAIANAHQLQGKALSYNNIADSDAALECVKNFTEAACVIVKHANPCGVAIADDMAKAYDKAYQTDPTSAFGGIIAFNCELDLATAKSILERQFVEVIIAPGYTASALSVLAAKPNIRVLACGKITGTNPLPDWHYQKVNGGLLIQQRDSIGITQQDLKIVTRQQPNPQQLQDLLFAWKVAKFVKSNAIVYARDGMTLGVGAGQMSRVYSARIAAIKATDEHLDINDSVMASDAFLPFRDGIDAAAKAGIKAVIQPGGSMRDEEVIAAANEYNMSMVFTNLRHFRH